jgi:hypothetical protein
MKSKLTASAVFCAALISGCSSAPTMAVPTGEWEDFNQQPQQPQGFSQLPAIPPAAYSQGPATIVYKPIEVAAFTPPKTPGSVPVKPEVPAIILPVAEKSPVSAQVVASTAKPVAPAAPGPTGPAHASASSKVALDAATSKPAAPSTAADKSKPAPGAPALVLASAEVKPVAPPPKPLKAWVVSPQDKTIRETLAKWSASEGWTFNPLGRDYWTVPQDFDVVASDTIYGDFKDAVRKLIASTELTKTPLQPCFFSNKAVRVILINEECAAQASQGRNP